MFTHLICFFSLLSFVLVGTVHASSTGTSPANSFVSEGERLQLADRKFSIIPPIGWEVEPNYPGLSLLLQVPKKKKQYQRTIQVMKFKEPIYIDETTALEFKEKIVTQYSKLLLGESKDYKIRGEHQVLELSDKSPAILYYGSFKLGGKDMMHEMNTT